MRPAPSWESRITRCSPYLTADCPSMSLHARRSSARSASTGPGSSSCPYWEDRHPDHPAASRIIEEAAFLAGLKKRDTGQEPHRPSQLVYYMSTWEFEPSFIVDVSGVIEEKRRTLQAYETQLFKPGAAGAVEATKEPPTFIASEQFHELLFARMAHYGHLIGKKYGEPFKIRGHLEVADLLQTFGDRTF